MIRGSCLCGKVSYEIRSSPRSMYYCHCSMCRKATGSSFATNMLIRAEDFVVLSGREVVKSFQSSPNEYRHFCSECGSPIYGEALKRTGVVSVRCGTLDTDPIIRPLQNGQSDPAPASVNLIKAWTTVGSSRSRLSVINTPGPLRSAITRWICSKP